MKASSDSRSGISQSSGRKRRLLSGAGAAALALALFLPAAASAADYEVNSEAELRQALLDAVTNNDPNPNIILRSSFQVSNTAFTLPGVPITIDTQGFVLTGPAGNPISIIGPTATLNLAGTFNGASGGGGYGSALTLNGGMGTVNSTATITGGAAQSAGQNPSFGLTLNTATTFVNNGSIRGGDVISAALSPTGTSAGAGVAIINGATLVNNNLIQGSNSQGDGAGVGVYARTLTSNLSIVNTGTIRGGSDVNGAVTGNFAIGGFGSNIATITNSGLIEGGNGAAAISDYSQRWTVTIINSGTIRAGVGQSDAIRLDRNVNNLLLLELRAGSNIEGNVIAPAGATFAQTLALGGAVDAGFDMSLVGPAAQYRNFTRFVKSGASTWTLTGNTSGMPTAPWELQQGTLVFDRNTAAGQLFSSIISSGTLNFQQDSDVSVGSINGGSVIQSGSGTTTLTAGAGYTYSGLTITGGKLSVDTVAKLGTGAIAINGGVLRWTGSTASIATAIGWGASGGGFEVAAGNLTLSQPLLGGGALIKSGGAPLTLAGDNTYGGGTTIVAGTLIVGNGGTTGSILGDVLNNGRLIFNRSNAYTYAGSVTGTGELNITGTGVITLTGSSNYGGATAVTGLNGELRIVGGATVTSGGATSINRARLSIDGANSVFSTASLTGVGTTGGSAIVNVTNGGTLRTMTGDLAIRALPALSAQLNIAGPDSLVDVAGGVQGAVVGNNIFSATITAGGTLRTAGASQIGMATSSNPLAVTITGTGSNWTSTSSLLMTAGSFTLDQGGAASFANATFGSSSAAAGAARLIVSGANSRFTTTTGDLVIGSGAGTGELVLGNGGAVGLAGSLVLADSGTATGILSIGGAEGQAAAAEGAFTASALTFGSVTSRLNFNHTGADYGFAAMIGGAGTILQLAGVTRLTGNSSAFGGQTAISGGTLLVNGTLGNATSDVQVLGGGTLGGSGTIGGNVFVGGGAVLAPGNSPGTLTINGNLGFSPNAVLNFELGQANVVGGALNDLINVGGDLTLDGTLNVTEPAGGSFGLGIYRLINYGGALTDNGLTIGSMPAGATAFVQTAIAGQVNLINTGGATLNYWDGVAGPKFDSVINGGSGTWQNSGGNDNWTDATGAVNAAFTDDAVAIFAGAPGTVTVDNSLGAVRAGGMQLATNGYVITGDAVTLTGPQATIRVGDGSAGSATYTATIASELAGASQLVKTDAGTLVLTGANSYTGGTRIEAGTLRLGNGGATGSITGDIVNNAALAVNRTGTLTLDGTISGSGSLTKTGSGTLILTGTSSYAGGTTVSGGTVRISSDANLGDVAGRLSLQGGTLQAGASFTSARDMLVGSPTANRIDTQGFDVTLTGTIGNGSNNQAGNFLDKIGSGTLTLTGANIYANRTVISGGTLALAGAGTAGAGNIIVGAGTVFDISQTNTGARVIQLNSGPAGTIALGSKMLTLGLENSFSDWSGTITDGGIAGGTGGRVVIGGLGGAVRFFEANSYTGGTTILSGSFELVGSGSLYSGGAVTVVTGGTFSIAGLGGPGTTIGDLSGSGSGSTPGAVVLGGKTLTFGTANDTYFSGAISGGGTLIKQGTGTFTLSGTGSHTGGTTIAAGIFQLGNGGTTGSIAGNIANNGTLVFNRSDAVTFGGTISGAGAVSQLGTGTTTLTAANSYTGITTVAAGTLRVNGDQSAATGSTQVLNGGTLGGNGIIGGDVIVADGGTLAPGNSPGTLTIAGNLALSSGSRLGFEFGQAGTAGGALNDLIQVNGNLTLDGTIDVTQSAGGSFGPGVFRIINYAGVLTNNGLSVGTMPAGSQAFVQTVVAGQVNLVNTAGLTLGFWDGAAGAKNDGAIQGGVGTWRVGGGENNWTEAFGAVNADYAQDSFAIFSGLGGTVTIDNGNGNVRAAGMQFAVDGYTLMGGPLELTGTQAFVRVGDGSAGDAAITATIASALTGSARLVKDMGGTLILTGANSYTGGTAINGGTLDVSSDANLGDAAGGLSFDGGTLDITTTFASSRAVNLVGTGTFRTQGTGFTLRGAVSGAGALVKEGSGTVTLTADNSYTGGTTINAGVLNLGDGGTTGSILGNIVNNGRLAINRSNMYTLAGTISGSGELFQMGTGTTILTAANSYTGATRVSAGTLLINGDQSAATGLTSLAANATLGGTGTIGGDVRVGAGTLAPGAGGAGTLTINGDLLMVAGSRLAVDFGAANAVGSPLNDLVNVGGNLTLDGTIDIAVTPGGAFDIGLYRIANYAGTLTNNGLAIGTMPAGAELAVQTSILGQVNLVNTGSAVLNFWDGNTGPKFNGVVNGGSGVWWATGTDNWTDLTGAVNASYDNGAFAVFAGASGLVTIDNSQGAVTASGLQFAASGGYRIQGGALTLTGPQSVIRVGDGTSAGLGYSVIIASEIMGNTQLVKTDLGRLELTGTNSYTGGTALNGGTLRISSDANLGAASGGLSFNGGTLNTTADISTARAVTIAGQGVFSIDAGTTLTLSGSLDGAGLIGKLGAGALVLAGTGSHTGGMEVVQGTLLVNGNYAAATGPLIMNQLTTLGGTGTIGGNVNLSGTLAPGANGAGTLTINGDLTISQFATLAYEFGQANVAGGALNDLVNVGGNLTLDGTINVAVPAGGAFSAGIYRVFNYGGTLTNNGLTLGAMPAGSNVGVQTSIAGQVNLVNFAGLALNFWDGAAGPKNNGVVNGGTGIWQSSGGNDNWTEAAGLVNAGYADGAFAVFGGTAGTVTVDNSLGQVTAGGMQFATGGYTITGAAIALTGGQATIRVGDGSTAGAGYTATVNAALSGASELVKTDAGTLVLGGTNSYTGGTRIVGGTVQIAADANLGAAAGGVTLDGGTLATSATLTSAREVNFLGAGTLSTASGTTFTLGGTLAGTGAFTKAGGGTLLLTGNNGGYAGPTRITGGTLAVMGAFGGAVDVGPDTRLEGSGTVGAVTNAGTVAPGRDGFGTLTVNGAYTSSNGILAIDAELGGDSARADRLVVNGATAGSTVIEVTNRGGLGAATVDGIKIVDVTGASNGAFTLGNSDYLFEGAPALIAGAYGYRLYKNGVTTPADGDWYLRSSLLQQPEIPLYQPGVPVYEAYGQTLAALNQLGTMQERTGNRQWAAGNARAFGIWGRSESKRVRPQAVRSTSFTDANVDSWKIELGADQVLSERADGASLVLGVLGSYGEASASIASPFGNGSIKTRGYSAGATLSWYGPQGFYVDGRAQVTWFDSKLTSAVLGKLADGNNGTGQAYSIEIGKRAPIGGSLSVTPQIQTVYSTVGFDRFTDPNDAAVSSKLGDSLKTRWGISLDRQDARSHLYGMVNLSYEWLDGTVTDVSGTPIARENHRLWGELGIGGSLKLGGRLTLYSEVSADTAINDFGDSYGLKGVAGLRMTF